MAIEGNEERVSDFGLGFLLFPLIHLNAMKRWKHRSGDEGRKSRHSALIIRQCVSKGDAEVDDQYMKRKHPE